MAEPIERYFDCARCGLCAIVLVEPAYRDGDEGDTLDVAVCPACARRRSVPWGRSLLRVLGGGVAGFLVSAWGLSSQGLVPVMAIALGLVVGMGFVSVGLLAGTVFEIRRWLAGGRVRVVQQLRAPRFLPIPAARQLRR